MILRKFTLAFILIACTKGYYAQETTDSGDGQKIIKVCTLNSIQANQEFQNNVQLLRLQRQKVIEIKAQIDGSADNNEKEKLQKDLDELLIKLNENNELMFKTYGFSLTRNYTMVVETAHVYMMVSQKEAKEFEEAQGTKETLQE